MEKRNIFQKKVIVGHKKLYSNIKYGRDKTEPSASVIIDGEIISEVINQRYLKKEKI